MILYEVADLNRPSAEPFAVLRVDTDLVVDGGVEATVESLHWSRTSAELAAEELRREYAASA